MDHPDDKIKCPDCFRYAILCWIGYRPNGDGGSKLYCFACGCGWSSPVHVYTKLPDTFIQAWRRHNP